MNKNIQLPFNEQQRLASLESYKILDTASETDFEDIALLASEICGTPIALITLVDQNRQWFKSRIGLDVTETPREYAFCAHTILDQSGLMQVSDARNDHRFATNPLVTSDPNIVFYAGITLLSHDGFPLGTLCVIDRVPRELSDKQLSALRTLAKQVMAQMDLRKQISSLEMANNQLSETNEFMQRFATSAAHDIKNPLSSISMSAEMLSKHLENTGDERGIRLARTNLSSTKQLGKLVNDMLEYSLRPEVLTVNQTKISTLKFLGNTVSMITMPENVEISFPPHDAEIYSSEIALQQIFINLLTNAIRYNDKEVCRITIGCSVDAEQTTFMVSDNGIGINRDELERIFDKKVTLNSADRFSQSGTGIGLFTVKFLIEKLGGSIRVESEPGKFSRFIFTITNSKIR